MLTIAESYRRIEGDTVGPYLKTTLSPDERTTPTSEPALRSEMVPDEGEGPRQERPVEDVPLDEVPEPDDRPDTDVESTTETAGAPAEDGATTEPYQYRKPFKNTGTPDTRAARSSLPSLVLSELAVLRVMPSMCLIAPVIATLET